MNERILRVFVKGDDLAITFDLVVDGGMRPLTGQGVNPRPGTGWWGNLKSNDCWPFALVGGGKLDGGKVDFGVDIESDINEAVRYAHTDILSTKIVRGEAVTVLYDESRYVGRITAVTDLLTLDAL